MPPVIHPSVALRSTFREIVREAVALNEVLERIITIKSWQPSGGGDFHGKISHSPPPWNSNAANAILDLHAWSRETEAALRGEMSLPVRARGGSSGNTRCALDSLVSLSPAVSDDSVYLCKNWLNSWCRKAEVVLGAAEAAKRLPREKGADEPVCPWCHRKTLRQLTLEGVIACMDPRCYDEGGRRPKARLEYFDGDWCLRWQDGILGNP